MLLEVPDECGVVVSVLLCFAVSCKHKARTSASESEQVPDSALDGITVVRDHGGYSNPIDVFYGGALHVVNVEFDLPQHLLKPFLLRDWRWRSVKSGKGLQVGRLDGNLTASIQTYQQTARRAR